MTLTCFEAKVDFEIVARALEELRFHYLRAVIPLVIVVVLNQAENPIERRSGNKDQTNPMVNEGTGQADEVCRIASLNALGDDFTSAQSDFGFPAAFRAKSINP